MVGVGLGWQSPSLKPYRGLILHRQTVGLNRSHFTNYSSNIVEDFIAVTTLVWFIYNLKWVFQLIIVDVFVALKFNFASVFSTTLVLY